MLKLKLTQTYYREVETIEEASREVRLYVDLFDLSASDYEDCELFNKQGHIYRCLEDINVAEAVPEPP